MKKLVESYSENEKVDENDHKRWMIVHHMQAPCPSKILNLEKWIVAIVTTIKEVGEEMSECMKIWYFRWNVFHLWSSWKCKFTIE